jgi:hypothetical protein
MRYIIAILVPPLAILLCGRWVHFVVNLILWLLSFPLLFFMGIGIFVWLLCAAYAIAICRTASMDKRVNDSNPTPRGNILDDGVEQERCLACPALADDIEVLASVGQAK